MLELLDAHSVNRHVDEPSDGGGIDLSTDHQVKTRMTGRHGKSWRLNVKPFSIGGHMTRLASCLIEANIGRIYRPLICNLDERPVRSDSAIDSDFGPPKDAVTDGVVTADRDNVGASSKTQVVDPPSPASGANTIL